MKNLNIKNKSDLFLVLALIVNFAVIVYFGYQNYLLKKDNLILKDESLKNQENFLIAAQNLQEKIDSTEWELEKTKIEKDDFETRYNLEKNKMDIFASQIGKIEGVVGKLEKLSKIDPELLKKYSKVYFLSENYIPESFAKIDPKYTFDSQEDYLIHSKVWPFLEDMLKAAQSSNPALDIKIISAYRSFGKQAEIKSSYSMTYGAGANKFSADQGYTEHQLGTTLDFTNSEVKATYLNFEKTSTYQWLLGNAYKYGFVLSYPENNIYYQFEPWHWRFVGRELAKKLHEENKNFYDLDQREIDQYLISFFD